MATRGRHRPPAPHGTRPMKQDAATLLPLPPLVEDTGLRGGRAKPAYPLAALRQVVAALREAGRVAPAPGKGQGEEETKPTKPKMRG